jgi:hypothetical protein
MPVFLSIYLLELFVYGHKKAPSGEEWGVKHVSSTLEVCPVKGKLLWTSIMLDMVCF